MINIFRVTNPDLVNFGSFSLLCPAVLGTHWTWYLLLLSMAGANVQVTVIK